MIRAATFFAALWLCTPAYALKSVSLACSAEVTVPGYGTSNLQGGTTINLDFTNEIASVPLNMRLPITKHDQSVVSASSVLANGDVASLQMSRLTGAGTFAVMNAAGNRLAILFELSCEPSQPLF